MTPDGLGGLLSGPICRTIDQVTTPSADTPRSCLPNQAPVIFVNLHQPLGQLDGLRLATHL
jgi:hypothetical protein